MDPRRFLIPAACGLLLAGCVLAKPPSAPVDVTPASSSMAATPARPADRPVATASPVSAPSASAPPPPAILHDRAERSATERPYAAVLQAADPVKPYRPVPSAAATAAPTPFQAGGLIGGARVFDWAPGRIFEVRAAPLRVTTLTFAPGEVLVSKAAGDTVRWQIGEVTSGAGSMRQSHVVLKPLQSGLDTNLILTTNRRVYIIDLKSGPVARFDPVVTWDAAALNETPPPSAAPAREPVGPAGARAAPVVMPQGEPDGRYRIEPQGRKARWTPTAVFNDGRRTFITFDPDLQVDEAPALFVVAPDGERQLVNYRQVGGLFVVDRVFDRAELRLGDRRPQIVVLRRLPGASS